jgi:hypothetical protein
MTCYLHAGDELDGAVCRHQRITAAWQPPAYIYVVTVTWHVMTCLLHAGDELDGAVL